MSTEAPDALDRWQGGKRWLPALYAAHLPIPARGKPFYEPFVGAAAVSIHMLKRGHRVVMGDANPRLIGAYHHLRENAGKVVAILAAHAEAQRACLTHETAKAHFVSVRDTMNASEPGSLESAAAFLFMLRAGFNGIYRVNQRGGCNTPWGDPWALVDGVHTRSNDLVRADAFRALGKLLRRAEMRVGDFAETTSDAGRGAAIYLDSPYLGEKAKPAFVGYAEGGFTSADRKRLAMLLCDWDRRGVRWLLSDAATAGAGGAYGLWHVSEVEVRRSSSCKAQGRGKVLEILVTNAPPARIDRAPDLAV